MQAQWMTPYPRTLRHRHRTPSHAQPLDLPDRAAHKSLHPICIFSHCNPRINPRAPQRKQSTMATIASTSAVASSCLLHKPLAPRGLRAAASARPITGLPALRMPKIVCSAEKKDSSEVTGLPQLAAAVTSAATMAYAHPVFALVDDRLSTEGTGLGLGLSNPKLIWILVGVTSLIWALYFVYASKLPSTGDDSGLDL